MSRLTNEQLKLWALPYSTNAKGDCAGVTKQLLEAPFSNYAGDPPNERRKKAVRIPLREKTSHMGVLLCWKALGDEVMVDATIQQFGGDERVFVGSFAAWEARLQALTDTDHLERVDADYGILYDVLDTVNSMPAMAQNDLRRSRGSASAETHKAETLKKGCGGCTLI